jgi:hypothetical protein
MAYRKAAATFGMQRERERERSSARAATSSFPFWLLHFVLFWPFFFLRVFSFSWSSYFYNRGDRLIPHERLPRVLGCWLRLLDIFQKLRRKYARRCIFSFIALWLH